MPESNLNMQKAADNFDEAMEISQSMALTGAAARLLELSGELSEATLEAKTEEAKTRLIEARIAKAEAKRRQQASMFPSTAIAPVPQATNALLEVPEIDKPNASTKEKTADKDDKDKEDAFEHSTLPTIRLISGSGEKYRAIISKPNGAPETIYAGDKVGTWTVRSINTSGVVVVGGDKKKTVEHLSFAAN